jgi:rubrerythrin
MQEAERKQVLKAIQDAIITELRGYEIYKAAAEKATDPNARMMFEELAEDERCHKIFLERNFKGLVETGKWTVPATAENLTPENSTSIFNSEFMLRIKGGDFEMAVVAAGCELELSAIRFYQKAAKEAPTEETAKVFRFLATWEEGHLKSLSDLESKMKDEYFADRGFAKF